MTDPVEARDSLERWALRIMLISLLLWPLAIVGFVIGVRLVAARSIQWGVWTMIVSLAEIAVAVVIIFGP